MMGQGKLREKWAEMALESNKLCTLDNHPHAELCHVVFDLFFFFHYDTTPRYIYKYLYYEKIEKKSKPAYFFHLYVNESGNFHLMSSHTYLSEVSVQNN